VNLDQETYTSMDTVLREADLALYRRSMAGAEVPVALFGWMKRVEWELALLRDGPGKGDDATVVVHLFRVEARRLLDELLSRPHSEAWSNAVVSALEDAGVGVPAKVRR
jgi:hypothetical protein